MHHDSQSEDIVLQAAARWLARHDRGLTPKEKREFACWLETDPSHGAVYKSLCSTWSDFEMTKAVPELAQMALKLDLQTRARLSRRLIPWKPLAMAAAAAIAACAGTWAWRGLFAPASEEAAAHFRVIPNTVRRLGLEDGSVVELRGSQSVIQTEFTATERRVTLLRGEGFFEVAKNPARPFIVTAGQVTIRAVGTAFNVQLNPANVAIVVTEGKISLEKLPLRSDYAPSLEPKGSVPLPPLVTASQSVIIAREESAGSSSPLRVDSLTATEIDETLSWQKTWLVFDATPLADTVKAFNRYGSQHLVVGDDSLRSRRLSGKFRADHIDGFIRLLERAMSVRAERRGEHEIVLMPEP